MNKTAPTDKVLCETPTPGKKGVRIPRWKFEAIRKAIRKVVPKTTTGIEAQELPFMVEKQLSKTQLDDLGSVTWHTVAVKLHMETTGELIRVEKLRPQRIRRNDS